MSEYIKLTLFVLGLICILMGPAFSWLCIIPGAWFWSLLHLVNWFADDTRWLAEFDMYDSAEDAS
jgi:hypothetical protein